MEKIEGKIIDFAWKTINKNYLIFLIDEDKRQKKRMFDTILKQCGVDVGGKR